jgi:hypothetical protein
LDIILAYRLYRLLAGRPADVKAGRGSASAGRWGARTRAGRVVRLRKVAFDRTKHVFDGKWLIQQLVDIVGGTTLIDEPL